MTSIYAYRKFIDSVRTVELRLPEDGAHQRLGLELATVDGDTYVSIPTGVILPEQPSELTVTEVVLTDELKKTIQNASPYVAMINSIVRDKISEQYSIEDEIKLLRTSPSPEFDTYNAYVEQCRAWGRAKKLEVGL